MALSLEEANALLPQHPTKAPTDPRRLKYLMIGPPKWGKTTLGCSAPDSVLLAFEEGHMFHETHKIIIDAWDKPRSERGAGIDDDGNVHLSFVEAVEAIVASDRFQFIIIDTADMAAKMCLDYHYRKYGVTHASDAGDYGKGWDLTLTQPFRQQVGQLMKAGRGIMFITHSDVKSKKVGNQEISREETTLPNQVQKFLHTQADVILHGKFGKLRKGMEDRDRIITMDGTNEILAGSRVRGVKLPKKYIVDPDDSWAQWANFFNDPEAAAQADKDFQVLVLGKTSEPEPDPDLNKISAPAAAMEEPSAPAAEEPEAAQPAVTTTKAVKKTSGRK